jgi:16S rRNA processing protein RimM
VEQRISVGKILGPHGVKGEVKVLPLTDFPRRFQKNKMFWIDSVQKKMQVETVRTQGAFLLMKFIGIEQREDAEKIKNALIQVEHSETIKLPPGQYYHFEIMGLKVFKKNGEFIGRVQEILETGANDIYIVERDDKEKLLVPALKKVVTEIDIANGLMVVELPPGLED